MEETTCAAVSRILSSDPKTLWKTDQWCMLEINKHLDVNKFTSDLDLVQNMNEYFEKVRQEEFQKVKKNKKEFEEITLSPSRRFMFLERGGFINGGE